MKTKTYKFENLLAGLFFQIKPYCNGRFFDVESRRADQDSFRVIGTFNSFEAAKQSIADLL